MNDYDISNQCPECDSYQTYLLYPSGEFRCESCGLIVDDDYWSNEPELKQGYIPEYVRDDVPDYLD